MSNRFDMPTPESLKNRLLKARPSEPPLTIEEQWGEWVLVQSSNLHAVRYNLVATQLQIQFKSGAIYAYSTCPEYIYLALLQAPSKGRYLHYNIKPRFPASKVSGRRSR